MAARALAAIQPVLTALQALKAASVTAQAGVAGLSLDGQSVQFLNNVAANAGGNIQQGQGLIAMLTPPAAGPAAATS